MSNPSTRSRLSLKEKLEARDKKKEAENFWVRGTGNRSERRKLLRLTRQLDRGLDRMEQFSPTEFFDASDIYLAYKLGHITKLQRDQLLVAVRRLGAAQELRDAEGGEPVRDEPGGHSQDDGADEAGSPEDRAEGATEATQGS